MKRLSQTIALYLLLAMVVTWGGCQNSSGTNKEKEALPPEVQALGPTLDTIAEVMVPQAIQMEGYGLVAGLPGTGSINCPTDIMTYLRRLVSKEAPDGQIDIDRLVASRTTSVVYIQGTLPLAAVQGDRFDLRLTDVSSDPTVSLEGGWVYSADLWPVGAGGPTPRTLARVVGSTGVFVDKLAAVDDSVPVALVLGGGQVTTTMNASLVLEKQDFRFASGLRNMLNDRFGEKTAQALSGDELSLVIPPRFLLQRERFFDLIGALYLENSQLLLAQRLDVLSQTLATDPNLMGVEILLEGLGNPIMGKLRTLIQHENPDVQLAAARCMLNMGSPEGLRALMTIAANPNLPQRLDAVAAVGAVAGGSDVGAVLSTLLRQVDIETCLAIYNVLTKLPVTGLPTQPIGKALVIHDIQESPSNPAIHVTRSLEAHIGLFGGPLLCELDQQLVSDDGLVTLDTKTRPPFVRISRQLPNNKGVIGPMVCNRRLTDVIEVLCAKPDAENILKGGCGLPYADLLPLLKQICEEGFVKATFYAGPSSEILQ